MELLRVLALLYKQEDRSKLTMPVANIGKPAPRRDLKKVFEAIAEFAFIM